MQPKQAVPSDLAGHRAGKGLSLQEIANHTKITRRYLEAIERGAFDALPGGIYNISYIRQYARAVECDEFALVNYYLEVTAAIGSD
jgi:cytoskeletal protein RodZ